MHRMLRTGGRKEYGGKERGFSRQGFRYTVATPTRKNALWHDAQSDQRCEEAARDLVERLLDSGSVCWERVRGERVGDAERE